ncbi:MAG: hypothetical protein N2234_08775, partial [Planctomycetota bacterium]|nr:hypothetical protein [Planctomycetota bacterium]
MNLKLVIRLLNLFFFLLLSFPLLAQEQKPVVEVEVVVHPPQLPDGRKLPMSDVQRSSAEQTVLANMKTSVGSLFSAERFDSDIKRLMRLKKYTVSASTVVREDGITVKLDVHLLPLIKTVEFKDPEGENVSVSDDVKYRLSTREGDFLNHYLLDYDAAELVEHFQKDGYPLTKVSFKLDATDEGVVVTFIVDKGPFVVILSIQFEGNTQFDSATLYSKIESRERTFLRSIFGGGYFVEKTIKEDVLTLKRLYYFEAFLDVAVSARTDVDYENGFAKVTFTIQEGRRYKVRNILLLGVNRLSYDEVRAKISTKTGDWVCKEKSDSDVGEITKHYHELGYITARVDVSHRVLDEEGFVDLVYRVYEGEQIRIRRILIEGNWRTRDKVIRRELTLLSGELCDLNRLRESVQRLFKLRYFSEVGVDFADTKFPHLKDLIIQVKETRCGQMQFGFSYGDLGFQGRFLMVHPNFDPFDLPTSLSDALWGFFAGRRFVGGGYILKLELAPGRTHSVYRLHL